MIKQYAKDLRKNLTPAEALLWKVIKGKKLNVKFRRQYIVDNFIIDFYSTEINLGIEVDGGIHLDPIHQINDESREIILNQKGIKIIRFTNHEVYNFLDDVIIEIRKEITMAIARKNQY